MAVVDGFTLIMTFLFPLSSKKRCPKVVSFANHSRTTMFERVRLQRTEFFAEHAPQPTVVSGQWPMQIALRTLARRSSY